jgi:exodeoxyribonuclease VII large subunit
MAAVQQHGRERLHEASHGALHALSDIRAGAGARLATARARSSSLMAQIDTDATSAIHDARRSIVDAERDVVARSRQSVAGQRKRTAELFEEVKQQARNTVRWGADAAEATFREVVAQGPQKTLSRGFAVVRSAEGGVIMSAAAAAEAKGIDVEFKDGSIEASVVRDKEKRDE